MANQEIHMTYLSKTEFLYYSKALFDILAGNMKIIAPTGNSDEEDYKCWIDGVSEGLLRDERQIVLIKDKNDVIGFFQYYVNTDTFMMEEIQIKPEYQGKSVFRKLYGFLINNLRDDIKFVEAYSNINNVKSQGILERLGLINIGFNKSGSCCHYKGNYSDLLIWYRGKTDE